MSRRQAAGKTNVHSIATSALRLQPIRSFPGAKPGTFFARDNVSNFITWCRHGLGVFECLLFETDDLILRKNEKHVILCLLEVARRAAKLGMPAPMLVHLEREIDREIAAEKRKLRFGGCQDYYEEASDEESDLSDGDDCVEYGPIPQIVTNDLKSLDEIVSDSYSFWRSSDIRNKNNFPFVLWKSNKVSLIDLSAKNMNSRKMKIVYFTTKELSKLFVFHASLKIMHKLKASAGIFKRV